MKKALEYSIKTDGRTYSTSDPKYSQCIANKINKERFLNGTIDVTFKHYLRYQGGYERKYGIGTQSSETVVFGMAAMVVRKGIPWANEYKHILL